MRNNHAILLAAGIGKRMGFDIPKALILLEGKPLFMYSLESFLNNENISSVTLVIHPSYKDDFLKYLNALVTNKPIYLIEGGETRYESSNKAVDFLYSKYPEDNVLIHDTARIFVKNETINKLIENVNINDATMLVIKSKDTIAIKNDDLISSIPNRNDMLIEQTPCAFKISLIYKAYRSSLNLDITDDCQVIKNIKHPLSYVIGEGETFKITYPIDLELAKIYLKNNID